MARREYIALAGSFLLIFLEAFVRIITLGLRISTLPIPYKNRLTSPSSTYCAMVLQSVCKRLQLSFLAPGSAVKSEE